MEAVQIQVAFTEGATEQKYAKEHGDHVTISYDYPKGENSSTDDLEKYIFSTCAYVPSDCSLELINPVNGYYFSYYEPGNYISDLGTDLGLDKNMSKEEQLEYYFANKSK